MENGELYLMVFFRLFIVGLLAVLGMASAHATPSISLKRGLPTDIWMTWPDEAAWTAPGFLEVFPEWRKSYGAKNLADVRRAGFDFIRLTIDPAPFLSNPTPERTRHMISQTGETIVEIKAAGLNVVVDLHAIPTVGRKAGIETYLKNDASFDAYLAFVAQMGRAISEEDPARVAFEPINEPTIDCPWETEPGKQRWPAMALRLHDVARKAAPHLAIIISGACWGGAEGLAKLDPARFRDDNMYWSFHTYEPFLVTHQGASWADGPVEFISGLTYPPNVKQRNPILKAALKRLAASDMSSEQKKATALDLPRDLDTYFEKGNAAKMIAGPFTTVKTWAAKYNIPTQQILLGEFGVIKQDQAAQTPESIRVSLIDTTRRLAEDSGMAWSIWSWGGSFGITEEETKRRFSPALLKALGLKQETSRQSP
jgi:endoglucanase